MPIVVIGSQMGTKCKEFPSQRFYTFNSSNRAFASLGSQPLTPENLRLAGFHKTHRKV